MPLHIALEEGEYAVCISVDTGISIGKAGGILLKPNNTTYSSAIAYLALNSSTTLTQTPTDATPGGWKSGVNSSFELAYQLLCNVDISIKTYTNSKTLSGTFIEKRTGPTMYCGTIFQMWKDTTTVWSSLGTLTFPFAQSGRVTIHRRA